MANIMAIVRAVLGALIGIGYGLLVGVVTFQLMQLTYDPRYPGAMIPDAAGWARLTAFFAAVMTGRDLAVYQAADAFELFTGLKPSVAAIGNAFDGVMASRYPAA